MSCSRNLIAPSEGAPLPAVDWQSAWHISILWAFLIGLSAESCMHELDAVALHGSASCYQETTPNDTGPLQFHWREKDLKACFICLPQFDQSCSFLNTAAVWPASKWSLISCSLKRTRLRLQWTEMYAVWNEEDMYKSCFLNKKFRSRAWPCWKQCQGNPDILRSGTAAAKGFWFGSQLHRTAGIPR